MVRLTERPDMTFKVAVYHEGKTTLLLYIRHRNMVKISFKGT